MTTPHLKISNQFDIDNAIQSETLSEAEGALIAKEVEKGEVIIFSGNELSEFRTISDTQEKLRFLEVEIGETHVTSHELLAETQLDENMGEASLDFFSKAIESTFRSTLFEGNEALLPYLGQNLHPVAQQNLLTGFSFYISELVQATAGKEVKSALETAQALTTEEKADGRGAGAKTPTAAEINSDKNKKSFTEVINALRKAVSGTSIKKFAQIDQYFQKNPLEEGGTNEPYFMNPAVTKVMFQRLANSETIESVIEEVEGAPLEMTQGQEDHLVGIGAKWNDLLGNKGGLLSGLKDSLGNIGKGLRGPLLKVGETGMGGAILGMLGEYINKPGGGMFKMILKAIVKMLGIGDIFGIIDESNIIQVREDISQYFSGEEKPNIDMLFRKKENDEKKVDTSVIEAFKGMKETDDKSFGNTVARVLSEDDFFTIGNQVVGDVYNRENRVYGFGVNKAVILYKEYLAGPSNEKTWTADNINSFIAFKQEDGREKEQSEASQQAGTQAGQESHGGDSADLDEAATEAGSENQDTDGDVSAALSNSTESNLAKAATAAVAIERLEKQEFRNIPQLTQYKTNSDEEKSKLLENYTFKKNYSGSNTSYETGDGKLHNEEPEMSKEDGVELDSEKGTVTEIPGLESDFVSWHIATIEDLENYVLTKEDGEAKPVFDTKGRQVIFSCEEKSNFSDVNTKKANGESGKKGVVFHGSAGDDRKLIQAGFKKSKTGVPFAISILSNGNIIMNQPLHIASGVVGDSDKLALAGIEKHLNNDLIAVELALKQKEDRETIIIGDNGKAINTVEDPTHNQLVASQNIMRLITHLTGEKMYILDSIDPVLGADGNGVVGMHGDFYRDNFIKAVGGKARSERQKWLYENYGADKEKGPSETIIRQYAKFEGDVTAKA